MIEPFVLSLAAAAVGAQAASTPPIKLEVEPFAEAIEADPENRRFTHADERDGLTVFLYQPRGEDLQTPHERDEAYVVVEGTGTFVNGERRTSFEPGDVLFAAAHEEHRFEDFTDDLAVWVFFYGPERGAPEDGE